MNAPASTHTHVGAAPPGYNQGWMTHTVHWHGFESLSALRGEFVWSPEFMLLGNQWRLEICPGGTSNAAEGMVTTFLANRSDKAIDIYFCFSVNDENGKQVAYEVNFAPMGDSHGGDYRGFTDFAERTTLLSSLVDGTLIIRVHMKLATPTKSVPQPFIPENPVIEMIQGLFLDGNLPTLCSRLGRIRGRAVQ
jgi:hypothetical protein